MLHSVKAKVKIWFATTKNYMVSIFDKFTMHKGKRSKFKTALFGFGIVYLFMQPWLVIRNAMASALTGFFINNLTSSTLDTVSEAV